MATTQSKFQMGYVKNIEPECGCDFARNKSDFNKRRFVYNENIDGVAFININGKNVKLQPVASSKLQRQEKIGNRSWGSFYRQ